MKSLIFVPDGVVTSADMTELQRQGFTVIRCYGVGPQMPLVISVSPITATDATQCSTSKDSQ